MPFNFYCRKNLQEMRRVQKAGGYDPEPGLTAMQLKEIREMLLVQQAEKPASASATSKGNNFGFSESGESFDETPLKGFGAVTEAPPPQEADSGDAGTVITLAAIGAMFTSAIGAMFTCFTAWLGKYWAISGVATVLILMMCLLAGADRASVEPGAAHTPRGIVCASLTCPILIQCSHFLDAGAPLALNSFVRSTRTRPFLEFLCISDADPARCLVCQVLPAPTPICGQKLFAGGGVYSKQKR